MWNTIFDLFGYFSPSVFSGGTPNSIRKSYFRLESNLPRMYLPLAKAAVGGKSKIKATNQLEGHSISNFINRNSHSKPRTIPNIPGNVRNQNAAILFLKPKINPNTANTVCKVKKP